MEIFDLDKSPSSVNHDENGMQVKPARPAKKMMVENAWLLLHILHNSLKNATAYLYINI